MQSSDLTICGSFSDLVARAVHAKRKRSAGCFTRMSLGDAPSKTELGPRIGERLVEPPIHGFRKRPHPTVIGAREASDNLRTKVRRGLETMDFGRRADRFDVRFPFDACATPREKERKERDEIDKRHPNVAHAFALPKMDALVAQENV